MEQEYLPRREHDEFARRMDEANERQSKRLALVEENVREIGALATSVERLAVSMENMAKEQEKQGVKLEKLEGVDGEMWRKAVGYAATAILGILIGWIFTKLGVSR